MRKKEVMRVLCKNSAPGLHHFHLVPSSSYRVTMKLVRDLLLLIRGLNIGRPDLGN